MRKRSGDLYSRIVAVAIDECHCVKNWGGTGFRIDYANIGTLREAFPNIPFIGLTATITPTGISYFFKSTRFKNPAIIRQTIRRTNVDIWIAPIKGKDHDDLRVLFPDKMSSAEDIPQTIIFFNSRVGSGRMAKWLRSGLPPSLQSQGETVIRSYCGLLDEPSKQATLELLRNGACRMVVCTDAFGLGMNIRAIPRVVIWKLDATVGIDGLYQRTGRAGRDTDERALALIFVSKANLSGEYLPTTPKVAESRAGTQTTTRKKTKQTKNPKSVSPTETQSSTANDDIDFHYTLPVSKETEPIFKKALRDIYTSPNKKDSDSHSESKLACGVHWVVQNEGCRQQPFLVAFKDPEWMRTCDNPGCDRCLLRHLIETNAVDSPPTLHGIPFTVTLAYQQHIKTPIDKSRKKRKQTKHTISIDRMAKLIADIKTWRKEALSDWAKRFPEMTVQIAFPDSRIVTLAGKVKNIGSEDDLIAALKECGYSIPASFITAYTKDLYSCISNCLKESHPPPQLQDQFDQAAGRAVIRDRPAEPRAAPVSTISQSTQSTPSIVPCPQQQAPVPSMVNPIPSIVKQYTTTSRMPHWPVPSISPNLPIPQRVPLAEKHETDPSAINIPVEQLPISQSNARRSATGQSMATQLPIISSTSLDLNDKGINTSIQRNLRKRHQPGKENSVPSSKKCKQT